MLKESEEIIKRRKLSLTTDTAAASATAYQELNHNTDATIIPPGTPPTPLANNMALETEASEALALTTTTSATTPLTTPNMSNTNVTTNTANTALHSLTAANSMVNTLLANNVTTRPAASIPDHYSLRWNNHQNHLMRAFDALLQSKTLVDVTLVCAETSIRAHKMVLSACSPFFQRVFADTPCKHPVIVLKDFRGWVVQAIIDFMYRGEISVPQEKLHTLIDAGESLQVRGLVESSIPEHTPTPAASPDDFGMIDTSLLSSELERCSSFDEESPSMVTSGSKIILPSRLFGASFRRDKELRKRERERDLDHDLESDHELLNDSMGNNDLCTSPMPRRKQARPRRRSGELPHDLISKPCTPNPSESQEQPQDLCKDSQQQETKESSPNKSATDMTLEDPLKTVIKSEITEPMEDDDEQMAGRDSGNDSHEQPEDLMLNDKSMDNKFDNNNSQTEALNSTEDLEDDDREDREPEDVEPEEEEEDIEQLIHHTNELNRRRKSALSMNSDGPEDLCTTKKDNDTSGHHSASDNEDSSNNNNSSKLNNNNRIVLSLKDIRQLNKPSSSSTPNSCNNSLNPFSSASLRDLRLDRERALETQCKMEVLEAQMQAAAEAAAAAAARGENPFQHMEHQMDLSLAAAAAAAAVSQQHNRERDQALQREHREMQQQHNAYANSILGQMGMPGMPPFGPGAGAPPAPGGPSAHERLEESMNRLSKEFTPTSPMSLPPHYNPQDGPPHPPSPLPFPGMSSLALTPPHSEYLSRFLFS